MSHQSADEVFEDYKSKMGNELGTLFHHCRQQFLATTILWDQYVTVFGNKDRVKLFNAAGGSFAFNVHWQFLNGVVLGIARLLDPPATGKSENLTLSRLRNMCDCSLSDQLGSILDKIGCQTATVRDLRNKVIAHNDLVKVTSTAESIEYDSRANITSILTNILSFLNVVERHHMGSTTYIMPMGNSDALAHLILLFRGNMVSEEERSSRRWDDMKFKIPEFLSETQEERKRYG